jgi:predicted ATPase
VALKSIKVAGLLSFSPDGVEIPLSDLTVLIGPNGSGKSNLLEILSLLRASVKSLPAPMKEMGGTRQWFWRADNSVTPTIEALVTNPSGNQDIRHRLKLGLDGDHFIVSDEQVENEHPYSGQSAPYYFYNFRQGYPQLKEQDVPEGESLPIENIVREESILSQVKDPGGRYPVISRLQSVYDSIGLFRIFIRWRRKYGTRDFKH